ncbi:MAG: hypothetical protein OIF48_17440, partial [Silicimonas sp.]|nr:hypothetical protein [Silicimonas sp.]
SNLLVDDLVSELELETVPEYAAPRQPGVLRGAARAVLRRLSGAPGAPAPGPLRREQIIDRVQSGLVIAPIGISHGIRIGVISTDADRAALIANTLPDLYIAQRYNRSLTEVVRAASLLEDRTATWREEVSKLEAEVVARRSRILELEQSNRLLTEQTLLETSSELNALRRERIALEARIGSLDALVAAEGLERAAHLVTVAEVVGIREELTRARLVRDERAATLGVENADSKAAEAQVAAITAMLTQGVRAHLQSLVDERALVASHETALAAQMRDATDASIALERHSIELGQLELEAAAARRVYEDLLHRLHETRAAQAFGTSGARVIERADVPAAPALPKKSLTLAGALVFGLFLGLAIIVVRQLLSGRVRSLREVVHLSGLPVIAVLEADTVLRRLIGRARPLGAPSDRVRDEIRKLRNAISLDLTPDAPARCILLTSSVKSAGQTAVTAELATSLAGHGTRVLLIDGDFRDRMLTRAIRLERCQGVSDVVVDGLPFQHVTIPLGEASYDFMPVGMSVPAAVEQLGPGTLTTLLDQVKPHYDLVLVDAGPWGQAAESALLAQHMDGVLLVVDVIATSRERIRSVADNLARLGDKGLGVVAQNNVFAGHAMSGGRLA